MTTNKRAAKTASKTTPTRKTRNAPKATRGAAKAARAVRPVTGGGARARASKTSRAKDDVPQLFRINLEVGQLDAAAGFYGKLLGQVGRQQAGSRVYFTCGAVTLQVVDVSSQRTPHPAAKALYFTVKDLDAAFVRAQELGCLSQDSVHGNPGGGITVRPWGERSFYAEDPWHNPLCFVEAGTVYPG